jgi:hypothetical protein
MSEFTYKLFRYSSGPVSTLGLLMAGSDDDLGFRCFTLEDEHRDVKVPEHTRIPAGRYEIKLRTVGGKHSHYSEKFDWHRGMLWLQDVPGFEWIYLHYGNKHGHTAGCILTGDGTQSNLARVGDGSTLSSVDAYKSLALEIYSLMDLDKKVFIEIKDIA